MPPALSLNHLVKGLAHSLERTRPDPADTANAGPSDSARGVIIAGVAIIVGFFGAFGGWALTAPLHGAVVANSVVKVEGNRKSVQHLDGGIVRELRVKEGDDVKVGDVVIALDDTQARAEYELLSDQVIVLRATEERLWAELEHRAMVMPEDLRAEPSTHVATVWESQLRQFESRQEALQGARVVIREKIAQLQHQITGSEAQARAYREQLQSVKSEMESIQPLIERGLIARPRYLQLERTGAGLEGQIADATANVAKARQAIAEQAQQIAQLDNDRASEVTKDLRDTQAKLLEIIPRRMNAQAVFARTLIRSPYEGRVVALNVFSVGGVIQRGEKIMDVVPKSESMIIEAQVAVEDISEVHPGMPADVHLTAYKQRITPVVHGKVLQVSADRLTDNRTGQPYYTAIIDVDAAELAEMPHLKLYPGMPATVMIQTVQRTAFDYVMGPLIQSFSRSFRQR